MLDALNSFSSEIPFNMVYEQEMLSIEYQDYQNGFQHKMSLTTRKLDVEQEEMKELLSLNNSEQFELMIKSFYSDQNIRDVMIFASQTGIVLQGLLPNNKRLVQAEILTD